MPKSPLTGQGRRPTQALTADRVSQLQTLRVQPQPLQPHPFGHSAVQRPFAVRGVAQDGVGDVLHVAAQLVAAARQRLQRQLGAAGAGKALLSLGMG